MVQASSFLSAVLLQISEAESYQEELLCNPSSTVNFVVYDSYCCYCYYN